MLEFAVLLVGRGRGGVATGSYQLIALLERLTDASDTLGSPPLLFFLTAVALFGLVGRLGDLPRLLGADAGGE